MNATLDVGLIATVIQELRKKGWTVEPPKDQSISQNDTFDTQDLGKMVAKTLALAKGDGIEIQRDKLDRNRIMI